MWRRALLLLAALLLLLDTAEARNQCPRGKATTVIRSWRQLLDCLGDKKRTMGTIPSSIKELSALTMLDLNAQGLATKDRFAGTLPTEIGLLSNLRFLDLSGLRLTHIPFEALPTRLEHLAIEYNKLVGQKLTSSSLAKLTALRFFDAELANLDEVASDAFVRLTELTHLNLRRNDDLRGALDLSTLQQLTLLNCDETRVSNLSLVSPMQELRLLSIEKAALHSESQFPAVAGMRKLRYLRMNYNDFGGKKLPTGIWDMPSMLEFDAEVCNLGGTMLDNSVNMPYMTHIRAVRNLFTGAFPLWSTPMPFFRAARVSENMLSSLSSNVRFMSNVQQLSLQYNNMTDAAVDDIPKSINMFNMSNNLLTRVPSAVAGLTNLNRLYLDFNRLRGTLPEGLARLTKLTNLFLEHNALTGPLPRLDEMPLANRFLLNDNFFTGSVPGGLTSNKRLEYLDLSMNRLSGTIPSDVGALTALRALHLRNNPDLHGVFPFSKTLSRVRVITLTNTSFEVNSGALTLERELQDEYFSGGRRVSLYMPLDELDDNTQPLKVEYDERVPGPPSAPRLVSVFENDAVLLWDAPAEPNGIILRYHVRMWRASGTGCVNSESDGSGCVQREGCGCVVSESTFNSLTARNLLVSTRYRVTVRGETSAGRGKWSAPLDMTTLSPCPAGRTRLRCLGGECPLNFVRDVAGDAGCVRYCDGADGTDELPGAVCENSTLESLRLAPGFWRLDAYSKTVLPCPRDKYCAPPAASAAGGGATRRALQEVYVDDADPYCSPHHRGVYCWECEAGFALRTDGCIECTPGQIASERGMVGVWSSLCLILVLVPAGVLYYRGKKRVRRDVAQPDAGSTAGRGRFATAKATVGKLASPAWEFYRLLGVRLRIAIGFYQVYLPYCRIFGLLESSSGDGTTSAVEALEVPLQLDVSGMLDALQVTCLLPGANLYAQLAVYTLLPLLMVAAAFAAVRGGVVACNAARLSARARGETLQEFAWFALFLSFLVYPGVSAKITSAFLFDSFDYHAETGATGAVTRRLVGDYSIQYEDNSAWTVYAAFMAVVYPVGVPVFYLVCLGSHRLRAVAAGCGFRCWSSRDADAIPASSAASEPDSAERGSLSDATPPRPAPESDRRPDTSTSLYAAGEQPVRTWGAIVHSARAILSEPYRPECDWYESLELVRKLLMTSGFLVLHQHVEHWSTLAFLLIVVVSYAAHRCLAPYGRSRDAATAEWALAMLLLLALLPIVQQLGADRGGTQDTVQWLAGLVGASMLLPFLLFTARACCSSSPRADGAAGEGQGADASNDGAREPRPDDDDKGDDDQALEAEDDSMDVERDTHSDAARPADVHIALV